jgi:hypothetical protein
MKNAHKRISLSDRALVIAILSIATELAGCAQDGPGRVDRVDRQIDQTVSSAGETVQDIQRSPGEQTEQASRPKKPGNTSMTGPLPTTSKMTFLTIRCLPYPISTSRQPPAWSPSAVL